MRAFNARVWMGSEWPVGLQRLLRMACFVSAPCEWEQATQYNQIRVGSGPEGMQVGGSVVRLLSRNPSILCMEAEVYILPSKYIKPSMELHLELLDFHGVGGSFRGKLLSTFMESYVYFHGSKIDSTESLH